MALQVLVVLADYIYTVRLERQIEYFNRTANVLRFKLLLCSH
jgi:hypothetical protein